MEDLQYPFTIVRDTSLVPEAKLGRLLEYMDFRDVLGPTKRLTLFTPIFVEQNGIGTLLTAEGAVFTSMSYGAYMPVHVGYYVYGFRGIAIALVMYEIPKYTKDLGNHISGLERDSITAVFALKEVHTRELGTLLHAGASITDAAYVSATRIALERFLRGEKTTFPDLPSGTELNKARLLPLPRKELWRPSKRQFI